MVDFTMEFIFVLIGLVFCPLLTAKQPYVIIQMLKATIHTIKLKSQTRQPLCERKYLLNVKYLWKDFEISIKRPELDSVLFNKVVIKFHKLRERKSIIAFILKGRHQPKFSRKPTKALKNWIDKEKEKKNIDINSIYIMYSIDFARATKV